MWWMVTAVAVVVVTATYVTWIAGRVDRLHARVSAADAALDAHLVRRAAAAAALAEAAQLPELMYAARAALDWSEPDREVAENDLTRELALIVGTAGTADAGIGTAGGADAGIGTAGGADGEIGAAGTADAGIGAAGGAGPAFAAVVAANRKVALARQVHSDLVRDALRVRRRFAVRLLRLARRHPVPAYFDIQDPTGPPPQPSRTALAGGDPPLHPRQPGDQGQPVPARSIGGQDAGETRPGE